MLVDFDVWGQQGLIFSPEEALLRIKDSYFVWKQSLKLKMFSVSDKHTLFTSQDIAWRTGVMRIVFCGLCDVFILIS